ncbi:MAG: hypothetical protein P1U58_14410 [Verrucomicrobiales bacterium]|nr:hypothetical protein [Verrucomicrobiales bacterium]
MFSETEGSRKAIGDVDVIYHEGLYHLFHLVLPNHDFIAHAVSTDAIHWRRVANAVFIGDPGSWDDLMLWTMHVSPDPHEDGRWRMFYTGLSRRDRGRFQRIGLATSTDLYHWKKSPVYWTDDRGADDPNAIREALEKSREHRPECRTAEIDESSCFPIVPSPDYYEAELTESRHMLSYRDPSFVSCDRGNYLILSARVKDGPEVRRGCVALLEETAPYQFEHRPPLHHPGQYDDIEVPNLFEIDEHYYLIGSIREDAKIRYWHSPSIDSEWKSYHDNVLMPQGNYAGRICHDDRGMLLWCFFSMNHEDRLADNLLPPPKRLKRDNDGLLYASTFEAFESWKERQEDIGCIRCLSGETDENICHSDNSNIELSSPSGFRAYTFDKVLESFWLKGEMILTGKGKCGLLFRFDDETHDGYYLSLDLLKGVAQLRSWGTGKAAGSESRMSFETLQSSFWFAHKPGRADISLLTFGSYLELSIDGKIVLSLADRRFRRGHVGLYLDTATVSFRNATLWKLSNPDQLEDQLVNG